MSTTRGDATVDATGGSVSTTGEPSGGNAAIGVLAEVFGPGSGTALISLNGTSVTTAGANTPALLAYTSNIGSPTGGATIRLTNAVVRTTGATAQGAVASTNPGTNPSPASISMAGGSVTTLTAGSPALLANSQLGLSEVVVNGNGSISTAGATAHGIAATSAGSTVDVQVLSGAVTTTGAGSHAVSLSAAMSSASVTNGGTLSAANGDGINANAVSGGATIISSGDIIANASGTAVVRGSAAADTFTAKAGKLQGITLMGDGADTVNLTGTVDVTAASQFDGGAGADTLNIDGVSIRGFTGTNALANGSNLTLWESIHVLNSGTLTLTGDLLESASGASLTVDATSTLNAKGSPTGIYAVNGNLSNSGMVVLADTSAAADDVLTIANSYTGVAGSSVTLDTVLGDSSSASDKLVVNGSTSGTGVLKITNAGGLGAATTGDGILVVKVVGSSGATFVLDGDTISAGAYKYSLHKVGNDWYLQSQLAPQSPSANTSPVAVPTLGELALAILAAVLGLLGVRRTRLLKA